MNPAFNCALEILLLTYLAFYILSLLYYWLYRWW